VTFQPVFPCPISDTTNFYLRPAAPVVIAQDVPTVDGFENTGLAAAFHRSPGSLLANGKK
jgi:hypothetical protein